MVRGSMSVICFALQVLLFPFESIWVDFFPRIQTSEQILAVTLWTEKAGLMKHMFPIKGHSISWHNLKMTAEFLGRVCLLIQQ